MLFISLISFILHSSAGAAELKDLIRLCEAGKQSGCSDLLTSPEASSLSNDQFLKFAKKGCLAGELWCCQAYELNSEVRDLEYWRTRFPVKNDLSERIVSAPSEVLEMVHLSNISVGINATPSLAESTPQCLEDFKIATRWMEKKFKRLIKGRLEAVLLSNNLGSAGYSFAISDRNNKPVSYVFVFDTKICDENISAWAQNKEPLHSGHTRIYYDFETSSNDTRLGLLKHLFVHELGHLISFLNGDVPPLGTAVSSGDLKTFPFMNISWEVRDDRFISKYDSAFSLRRRLSFYNLIKKKHDTIDLKNAYSELLKTDFVNLYAAQNPYEDFAESFALYVHTVKFRKPYKVVVDDGFGRPLKLTSCFLNGRCAKKKAFFDQYISKFNIEIDSK